MVNPVFSVRPGGSTSVFGRIVAPAAPSTVDRAGERLAMSSTVGIADVVPVRDPT